MGNVKVIPSTIQGTLVAPPSKSQTLRAILWASLAQGRSVIHHVLASPDVQAMVIACRQMGAKISPIAHAATRLAIHGVNAQVKLDQAVIDAGNSGIVFRFMAAIAVLSPGVTTLTGDASIRNNRPVLPLVHALMQWGSACTLTKNRPPLTITGLSQGLDSCSVSLTGEDSQPVSALLMAGVFLAARYQKTVEVMVSNPGETPWIDLTLSWLDRFGIVYENTDYQRYCLYPKTDDTVINHFEYTVPGDWSSIAYPLVTAVLGNTPLIIKGIDTQDPQGDQQLIAILMSMGADIQYHRADNRLQVIPTDQRLQGRQINVNSMIDALPILAVLGCYAQGTTHLTGARIARYKESDRLAVMCVELKKMGANITLLDDGLRIEHSLLQGAVLASHHDHRVVMALTVAALLAVGNSHIQDIDCVRKSYPDFFSVMQRLGADVEMIA